MDVLTRKQRSYCMSRIKNRDTKPELAVRQLVHSMGIRFRLHRKDLPGTPDLVFPARKKVIFVHGCFWHRHNCRKGQVIPKTNRAFWETKIENNRQRDKRSQRELRRQGWSVLTVWECQVTPKRRDWLVDKLVSFLFMNL